MPDKRVERGVNIALDKFITTSWDLASTQKDITLCVLFSLLIILITWGPVTTKKAYQKKSSGLNRLYNFLSFFYFC